MLIEVAVRSNDICRTMKEARPTITWVPPNLERWCGKTRSSQKALKLVFNHCGTSLYRLGNISENKQECCIRNNTQIFLEGKKEREKRQYFKYESIILKWCDLPPEEQKKDSWTDSASLNGYPHESWSVDETYTGLKSQDSQLCGEYPHNEEEVIYHDQRIIYWYQCNTEV